MKQIIQKTKLCCYTRGETLIWALYALIFVTVILGVLIMGMNTREVFTEMLRQQVAETSIDNFNKAMSVRLITKESIDSNDFEVNTSEYTNNAKYVLQNSQDARLGKLVDYWWSVPDTDTKFSRGEYTYKLPTSLGNNAPLRITMKELPWRMYHRTTPLATIEIPGMEYNLSDTSEAIYMHGETKIPQVHNIESLPTGTEAGKGVPYILRIHNSIDTYTELTLSANANTKYKRGTGNWIIQVVNINEYIGDALKLHFDPTGITEVPYNNNHAWYITTSSAEYTRKTIIIDDNAPIIVSPTIMADPQRAITLISNNSTIIIGDLDTDFPQN